jgi:Uma2 family endonuclease
VGKGWTPDTERVTTMATTARTVLPGGPPFSVDDLLKFPDDGNRYELFDGSLLVSPAPTPLHQRVTFRLQRVLDDVAPSGLEPLATVNLRVSDKDSCILGLVVVREASTEAVPRMFAPEDILLAVEVAGPSTRAFMAEVYAAAGIPVYWRIETDEAPTLYVHELDGDSYGPPSAFKAGAMASLSVPYPVSFDPGELTGSRQA